MVFLCGVIIAEELITASSRQKNANCVRLMVETESADEGMNHSINRINQSISPSVLPFWLADGE
jgi:hypothetical protein